MCIRDSGVADAGHVASAGLDREAVEVGAVEDDSRSRGRGQNPQADRGAAVETHSGAGHRGTNCLLMCQRGDCISLLLCISLQRRADFCMWQNSHTSWLVPLWERLSCSDGYGCWGVPDEELGPVLWVARDVEQRSPGDRGCAPQPCRIVPRRIDPGPTVSSAALPGRTTLPLRTSNREASGCSWRC